MSPSPFEVDLESQSGQHASPTQLGSRTNSSTPIPDSPENSQTTPSSAPESPSHIWDKIQDFFSTSAIFRQDYSSKLPPGLMQGAAFLNTHENLKVGPTFELALWYLNLVFGARVGGLFQKILKQEQIDKENGRDLRGLTDYQKRFTGQQNPPIPSQIDLLQEDLWEAMVRYYHSQDLLKKAAKYPIARTNLCKHIVNQNMQKDWLNDEFVSSWMKLPQEIANFPEKKTPGWVERLAETRLVQYLQKYNIQKILPSNEEHVMFINKAALTLVRTLILWIPIGIIALIEQINGVIFAVCATAAIAFDILVSILVESQSTIWLLDLAYMAIMGIFLQNSAR